MGTADWNGGHLQVVVLVPGRGHGQGHAGDDELDHPEDGQHHPGLLSDTTGVWTYRVVAHRTNTIASMPAPIPSDSRCFRRTPTPSSRTSVWYECTASPSEACSAPSVWEQFGVQEPRHTAGVRAAARAGAVMWRCSRCTVLTEAGMVPLDQNLQLHTPVCLPVLLAQPLGPGHPRRGGAPPPISPRLVGQPRRRSLPGGRRSLHPQAKQRSTRWTPRTVRSLARGYFWVSAVA